MSRALPSSPSAVPVHAEPNDAIGLARECAIMVAARRLAESTGPQGRRVTPAGALAPAEVPGAAAALALRVTPPVRRAADVPDVHRGWLMAIATGMIQIASGRATAEDVTSTGGPTDDDRLLAGWLEGLLLICNELSGRQHPQTLKWLLLLTLEALLDDGPPPECLHPITDGALFSRVDRALGREDALRAVVEEGRVYHWLIAAPPRGRDWRLFGLLADAGAVRGTASAPEVTALGHWLARRLRAQAPVQIAPDWPASAVLAQLRTAGADADLWRLSRDWRWKREPEVAADQLLAAAAGADAATRSVAVRLVAQYGEAALPGWSGVLASADLGPHAREALSWWRQGPGARTGDRWWLGVEWAAAALVEAGPDEALSYLADAAAAPDAAVAVGPAPDAAARAEDLIAALPGSGHPQAAQVAQGLTAFIASGAPRSIEHQLQVRVRLARWRPAAWRRVLLPATNSLGSLSWVISVLFGWGGGHLHVFQIGPRTFSDPAFPLDEAHDEDDVRLSRLFATGVRTLTYTYDLGAGWKHDVVLEKLVPNMAGQPTLRCVSFAGDSPLEYPRLYDEDGEEVADPVVTKPFDLDKVNARLASGHYLAGPG